MHVPDAPARRRRRGEPTPSTNLRASRLAARCGHADGLAALLADELLTVRRTFRVDVATEDAAALAARLLACVLPRAIPPGAVGALATELRDAGPGAWSLTDVDVRLWFLAWSLGEPIGHHGASRST